MNIFIQIFFLFVFIFISLIAVWLFYSIAKTFFIMKHDTTDDLPLDMIYKSDEEVEKYRKYHNISNN